MTEIKRYGLVKSWWKYYRSCGFLRAIKMVRLGFRFPEPGKWEIVDEINHKELWKKNYAGDIKASKLILVNENATHRYYKCPCGQKNHFATRSIETSKYGSQIGWSSVLHCYETDVKWHIDSSDYVVNTISGEEKKFNILLDKFEKKGIIGSKVSAKEAFRLYTEQGCPVELLDVDNLGEYDALFEDHRIKSRKI